MNRDYEGSKVDNSSVLASCTFVSSGWQPWRQLNVSLGPPCGGDSACSALFTASSDRWRSRAHANTETDVEYVAQLQWTNTMLQLLLYTFYFCSYCTRCTRTRYRICGICTFERVCGTRTSDRVLGTRTCVCRLPGTACVGHPGCAGSSSRVHCSCSCGRIHYSRSCRILDVSTSERVCDFCTCERECGICTCDRACDTSDARASRPDCAGSSGAGHTQLQIIENSVETPEIRSAQGSSTSASLGPASVRPMKPAETMKVVEIERPLSAESVPPMRVTTPVVEAPLGVVKCAQPDPVSENAAPAK